MCKQGPFAAAATAAAAYIDSMDGCRRWADCRVKGRTALGGVASFLHPSAGWLASTQGTLPQVGPVCECVWCVEGIEWQQ